MIDREKVELGIKACWSEYFSHRCCDCPYMSDRNDRKCVERLGADAIELLKEQEAVKPLSEHKSFICPVCKNALFREQKFCHECGKRINWEGSVKQE